MKKLGFGLMRLPMLGGEIDIGQVCRMCDRFLESGFNYFDTAYGYNQGASEAAVKKALTERHPRESFRLATKLPAWAGAKTKAEAERMFHTSLERTGAGYFDRYLLHNLGGKRTQVFDDFGIWDFLAARKAEGLIRELGFSMHDTADALDAVLRAHPEMDFVQLQINYADWEDAEVQSRLCWETARRHGKPVIVMEPVKGGMLADPPASVRECFRSLDPAASPSSWAIRFAASLEGVDIVLSGMSSMAQMEDNISYMRDFRPLSQAELEAVETARRLYEAVPLVPCTRCGYCREGCPEHINIPGAIGLMNEVRRFENLEGPRHTYGFVMGGAKASDCIACGQCEAACPQKLPIVELMQKAAATLE
ncbi:MAG: aldo/keto reductase [Clostridia bacterium]|nr:aldo/keto reductase [Clostridia bacterium]